MDILPDNVFLEIFHFYLRDPTTSSSNQRASNWQTLVHVCRRWRRIVFASPRQLNLHLHCFKRTPVRKNLVFWPVTLPLTLNYFFTGNHVSSPRDEDNIAAALEQSSRVHRIAIFGRAPLIKKVAAVMRKSFPVLTYLELARQNHDSSAFPVIPRRLLGGSAPRLQHLRLESVSFPRLPTFLLSARNLVTLQLKEILGYISPEAMAGSLAVLTRLMTLSISFDDEVFTPDQQTNWTDPPIRVILPALSEFHYRGCSEYLEDFLAQVDTPQLNHIRIGYVVHDIQALQLSRFIERTENLKLDKFTRAKVIFHHDKSYFELGCPQRKCSQAHLSLEFCYQEYLYVQVPCMADALGQLAAVFPDVDDLSTHGDHVMGLEEMGITQWLPFFHRFPAVQALRLSGGVKTSIVSALEETTRETVTDHVFPVLRLIWLVEDGVEDEDEVEVEVEDEEDWNPVGSIGRFLSLRHLAGRPVTVVNTEDEFVEAEQSR